MFFEPYGVKKLNPVSIKLGSQLRIHMPQCVSDVGERVGYPVELLLDRVIGSTLRVLE
ncbi:Uncharacterised protein [Mycobacteroides abscessus]|nr:Uncharacterised protein [Mycobacteroides abscessus]SII75423.1 Uncharacterised protein [Mycobacteroides abscessus subsp. abscessus]